MKVSEAIRQRHSVRAFLSEPVSKAQIDSILDTARFAPSGVNMQPWQVAVVTGQTKKALSDKMISAFRAGQKEEMDYQYYPSVWTSPYKQRRVETGKGLYQQLSIAREDHDARLKQWEANYRAFDAPVMLLFFIAPELATGSYLDYGLFLQNIMLLAEEVGLASCPQGALAEYPKIVKETLGYDSSLKLIGGMALGYEDKSQLINHFRTDREALESFTRYFN